MKVFISSLITGFEAARDAVASGIKTLGSQVIRAEDFGASPSSPQQACLAGVRDSDVTVLILGDRYGFTQASDLSATHEEYREARDAGPVLVFIQRGAKFEERQHDFVREVQGWERGHFTAEFTSDSDLRDKVINALHNFSLSQEAAPLDEAEVADRAIALASRRRTGNAQGLVLAVAGGPRRAVLRPAELESPDLQRFLLAEVLTGPYSLFSPAVGTNVSVTGDTVLLAQTTGSGFISLDESANLVLGQPAHGYSDRGGFGIVSLVEEEIDERISRAIHLAAAILDHIDPSQRVSHVSPVVALDGVSHMPWRTRAEQERSPNQATMGSGKSGPIIVTLSPTVRRRAALVHDAQRLSEDFTVRLRREVKR